MRFYELVVHYKRKKEKVTRYLKKLLKNAEATPLDAFLHYTLQKRKKGEKDAGDNRPNKFCL